MSAATLKKVRRLSDELYVRAAREAFDWLHSLPDEEMRRGWREALWPVLRDRWPPCDNCPIDLPNEELAAYFKQQEESPPTNSYESLRMEIAAINGFRETLKAERMANVRTNGKN